MAGKNPSFITWLWFETEAEQAVKFYTSLFPNSSVGDITKYGEAGFEIHKKPPGSVMTVEFTIGGQNFGALNGGPMFKMNPAISFFVVCETKEEFNKLWDALAEGGKILMGADNYGFSELYGWVQDRYGASWQVFLGKMEDVGQKISTSFLFVNKKDGRAKEAVNFYTSIFENSRIQGILEYAKGEEEPEGTVKHAQFNLLGKVFMAMDSTGPHNFDFNEAISIAIDVETQEEIDYYWEKLTEGGREDACGWLKDKFGVSWQVNPVILSKMLKDPDTKKVERLTETFLQMKKFDIRKLEEAFNGK